jgi:hypothetical protein
LSFFVLLHFSFFSLLFHLIVIERCREIDGRKNYKPIFVPTMARAICSAATSQCGFFSPLFVFCSGKETEWSRAWAYNDYENHNTRQNHESIQPPPPQSILKPSSLASQDSVLNS